MEEEEGPVSLFVVVYSFRHRQLSILQVKRPEKDQAKDTSMDEVKVVRFIPPEGMIRWYVSPPTTTDDYLYIFPSSNPPPSHSYQFNFMEGSFKKIKPPSAHKYNAFVANLGRHHYYISTLNYRNGHDNIDFECYDPDQNSWKSLKPFPKAEFGFRIVATAVCDDTILFNVDHCVMCAYNVTHDNWYPVDVDTFECHSIVGNAVLVQGTIYALANLANFPFNTVLALSFSKNEESNGDLVYTCSLHSVISVPGMESIFNHERAWTPTMDLLHLGERNFCLVQTCMVEGSMENLFIRLTYMKLNGENLAILMHSRHKLKIQGWDDFEVVQCFFLPECKATAFQGGKRFDFEIGPHEVHSVFVRNLPRDTTVEQVEKGLNVFGPIVRDGILFRNKKKKKVSAFVEFESAASKQRAIEAKTVNIGDCRAEIYDKEGNTNKKQPHSSGVQKDVQAQ